METMERKRPRPRRSFTPEFKAQIVEVCQRGNIADHGVYLLLKRIPPESHLVSVAYGINDPISMSALMERRRDVDRTLPPPGSRAI